ncbi:hypothetical protein PSTG_18149, partial [Puccinia striiformis f. sp. tritici PST-78]
MVVHQVLKKAKLKYVLTSMDSKLRPATWEDDNETVCTIIMQIVDPSNLRYLREHPDDAAGMWNALSRAHQDCSTGGRVYWIRKLVNARMEGEDINSHIESLAKSHERLNSLVTPEKPLTPDDVHIAALTSSIPPDWIHCISALMNQEGVKAETIVSCLKNEAIRRESQGDIISVSSTKTNPSKPKPPNHHSRPGQYSKAAPTENDKKPRRCPLCNSDTHDLNRCRNTKQLIADHKAAQQARREKEQGTTSSAPAARAGRTSAATLGQSSTSYDEDEQSDYSGSYTEVTAGNAVASLSSTLGPKGSGDANLDSGCS